jgi:hypothetical protein
VGRALLLSPCSQKHTATVTGSPHNSGSLDTAVFRSITPPGVISNGPGSACVMGVASGMWRSPAGLATGNPTGDLMSAILWFLRATT